MGYYSDVPCAESKQAVSLKQSAGMGLRSRLRLGERDRTFR